MHNQVTDRFKLVYTQLVKAAPAFGRTITAIENYSLEVFRGEFHRGSVRLRESGLVNNTDQEHVKMRVYNGEIIFWVSLVSQPVPISGHFMTRDKYVRVYDVTYDVVVCDSILFIKAYRLGKDPIGILINELKSSLEDYASHTLHDRLARPEKMNDGWNNRLCTDTGMKVQRISQWSLRDDPKRKEIDAVIKDSEIKSLKERLDRERDAEQKAYEREENTRQHMHKLHWILRDIAAQELSDILRERIRYAFEANKPIDVVAEDSLKLLNAFHESLDRGYLESTFASGFGFDANDASPDEGMSTNGIFSHESTTASSDRETDPAFHRPPNLADLMRTIEEEAEEQ